MSGLVRGAGLVGIVLVLLSGCGRTEIRPPGSFSGVVTLDEKPLESGSIQFTSLRSGEAAYCNLDTVGRYSVKFPEADLGTEYQVTVGQPIEEEVDAIDSLSKPVSKAKNSVPVRYGNRGTSGLSATLKLSGDNQNDFHLQSSSPEKSK